ncbi:MAG: LysM peptidoglycan-binding domain-containing protein [Verrucomicrobiota bacterium]
MNTPSPLSPLSPLAQAQHGKSNVRIAVISIIALHVVFFGGLLLLGCKKSTDTALTGGATNTVPTNDLASLTGSPYAGITAATNLPAASNAWTGQPTNWSAPATNVEPAAQPVEPVVAATAGGDYKVKAGDTPARIAKAHGVSLDALLQANPGLEPRKLQVNQTIHIPGSTRSTGATATATGTGAEAGEMTSVHEVKAGENLTRIAKKHGVSVKAIRQANDLKSDRINVGQKLKIPAAKLAARTVETPAPVPPVAPAPNTNQPIPR